MPMPVPLLLLEDNDADAYLLTEMLEAEGSGQWQVTHVKQLSSAIALLQQTQFEVALLGLSLPDSQGLATLQKLRSAAAQLPIVILTKQDDRERSIQAVTQGAQDYLVKECITPDTLERVLRYAIERGRILKQLQLEITERQRSEHTLRLLVEGTAAVTGEAFFRSLVRSLAEVLNVRYALVSGCIDSPPTRVCTYAFWQNYEFSDNIEYDLYGTPCEQVFSNSGCTIYPQGVQELFPADEFMQEVMAESYAGIPLYSMSGKLLGHLAVIDDKLLGNEPRNTAILEIFAARAASEIERQQAEKALQASKEKFAKAFNSSPSAITISATSNGQYLEVNASCQQIFGFYPSEMMGSSALDLGIWVNSEDHEHLKQQLQLQGRIENWEVMLRRKSGEVFAGLMSVEPIQLEDQPCLLTITTDITLLKRATRALEQLAEIGELAAMIVHEIRNPLTTVLMALNAFKKIELPTQFQTYLGLGIEESERLQRLLNQILLYAKPQNLYKTEIELNQFISGMLNTLQSLPVAANKCLRFEAASVPIPIPADADKLKQVVVNLVTNAFEAIEPKATVTLSLSMQSDRWSLLQVSNGGSPIPADILPKLSRPFFTTKSNGTGLGLAIVKRIVEAHDGRLSIESAAATGTVITIQLPLVTSANLSL